MIGYIPVRNVEHEDHDQGVDSRSPVFDSKDVAQQYGSMFYRDVQQRIFNDVWEIDLSSDPRVQSALEYAQSLYNALDDPRTHWDREGAKDTLAEIIEALS